MTRSDISPEALTRKGYKAYLFSDWTLERACEYIRNGCECKLKPNCYGHMVGVVIEKNNGHVYEHDVFSRPMTPEELARYGDWMAAERRAKDAVGRRIDARNMAKLRRRR